MELAAFFHLMCVCLGRMLLPASGQGQRELRYAIQEELDVGTIISDVINDADLDRRYSKAVLRNLRFRFLSHPPFNLTINETSGLIRTSGRVDREEVCKDVEPCQLRLDVAVTPMTHFAIIKISLELMDLNDNSPEFQPDFRFHEMSESSYVGSGFQIPSAKDRDVGRFSVQRYELVPTAESECFELTSNRKPDGSTEVKLTLSKPLDRETRDRHRLKVIAYDGGQPSKSGSIDVEVAVSDANDNPPVFEYDSYEVTIPENLPIGTTVTRVHALDRDIGSNSQVVYYFGESTAKSVSGNVFAVNSTSGEIVVTGNVDFEVAPVHRLLLSARDRGSKPLSSDTMVVIQVEDKNDNPPQIFVNTLAATSEGVAKIQEGVALDTFVAHVLVKDPDSGPNGRYHCSLDDPNFRLKVIFDGEYQVVTKWPLDREKIDKYIVTVKCEDGGKPSLISSARIEVEVTDGNDNAPVFDQSEYRVEIKENNSPDVALLRLSARDVDDGQNAMVVYKLPKNMTQIFEIDSKNGILRSRHPLDREAMTSASYHFFVYAIDHGRPAMTGSTLVSVTIADVNDESPVFLGLPYEFEIYENEESGTEVGTVSATDADASPFNVFRFALVDDDGSDAFLIDPIFGKIVTKRALNREQVDIYRLTVLVSDSSASKGSLESTATVTIEVLDVNDNYPSWKMPDRDNFQVSLSNSAQIGSVVIRLLAVDLDEGSNAEISYSFRSGSDDEADDCDPWQILNLDSSSGTISVANDLSEFPDNFTVALLLEASDNGSQPMTSTRRMTIVLKHIPQPTVKPQGYFDSGVLTESGLIPVAALSLSVGLVLVVLFTVAFLWHRHRARHRGERFRKYNCRLAANAQNKTTFVVGPGDGRSKLPMNDFSSDSDETCVIALVNGKPDILKYSPVFIRRGNPSLPNDYVKAADEKRPPLPDGMAVAAATDCSARCDPGDRRGSHEGTTRLSQILEQASEQPSNISSYDVTLPESSESISSRIFEESNIDEDFTAQDDYYTATVVQDWSPNKLYLLKKDVGANGLQQPPQICLESMVQHGEPYPENGRSPSSNTSTFSRTHLTISRLPCCQAMNNFPPKIKMEFENTTV